MDDRNSRDKLFANTSLSRMGKLSALRGQISNHIKQIELNSSNITTIYRGIGILAMEKSINLLHFYLMKEFSDLVEPRVIS